MRAIIMGLLNFWKKIPGYLSRKAITSGEPGTDVESGTSVPWMFLGETSSTGVPTSRPSKWYLDRITECVDQAQRMTSRSNVSMLYHNQCHFLVDLLKSTIEVSRKSYARSVSPEHEAECLEAVKLMYRVAKEVQSFIEDCCKEPVIKLMQFALTSRSVAVRVSSWGYHLRLCAEAVRNSNKLGAAWVTFTQLEGKGFESGLLRPGCVEQMAFHDEGALMNILKIVMSQPSGKSKSDKEVAGVLLRRLRTPVQATSTICEVSDLEVWKVDGRQLHRLSRVGYRVFSGKWFAEIKVAIKSFHSEGEWSYFRKEVDLLAAMCHPNIVTFLGFTTIDRNLCGIVLELMDANLRLVMENRLQENSTCMTPFTIWVACDIMHQVAKGVQHMHQNRVVHGDIKSSNILVKKSDDNDALERVYCAKVCDLGLSERIQRNWTYSEKTMHKGTKRWMAPELMEMYWGLTSSTNDNVPNFPFKSDVYSFGMLCYEILTGEEPFHLLHTVEVREQVLKGHRPKLPGQCPQNLKNLIELCWDPHPSMRPSFIEVCEELRHIRCCLLLEPPNQGNTNQVALPSPEPLVLPSEVSSFKGEYSCLQMKRMLGSGGSDGVNVYLSTWRGSNGVNEDVAQKHFVGSHNQSFLNEVSILAGLEHSNVVRLRYYASDRRSCSIVMELMDEDLHGFLMRQRSHETHGGPFLVAEAVHVILGIARGMEYVHGKKVVHRDLKSSNILVKKLGEGKQLEVKVADFGVSKKLDSSGHTILENSCCVGTIRWMAPEVLSVEHDTNQVHLVKSSKTYDPFKCDVWSFGMVCYEIFVGRVPFHGIENLDEVKRRILEGGRPTLPEWMPSNLKSLIEKCWQQDSSRRPSFVDIIKELI